MSKIEVDQVDPQSGTTLTLGTSGDTVNIPAGEYAFVVSVGKDITLRGAGIDITTTTGRVAITDSSPRITEITFSNTYVKIEKGIGWRVDHCKFIRTSTVGDGVWTQPGAVAHPSGLIDNCTFINTRVLVYGSLVDASAGAIWDNPLNLGGNTDVIYIEDCNFNITLPQIMNVIDGNDGAGYVARFNTFVNGPTDAHSFQNGNSRGFRKWEIYNNTWDRTAGGGTYNYIARLRAGTGVVFNNTITPGDVYVHNAFELDNVRTSDPSGEYGNCDGSNVWDGNTTTSPGGMSGTATGGGGISMVHTGAGWDVDAWVGFHVHNTAEGATSKADCYAKIISNTSDTLTIDAGLGPSCSGDSTFANGETYDITIGYPCRDSIGRGPDTSLLERETTPYPSQALVPAYAWGNTYNFEVYGERQSKYHTLHNRDYYNYDASFDGSSGMGSGTRVQMDACTTCTDNTAFWVTDEGTWNKNGDDGRLYQCRDNAWVLYYEPYNYPHPLRKPPPQNLRIVD